MPTGTALHVKHGEGPSFDLGVAAMRLLAVAEDTGGAISLAEFKGKEGPWTVPHVHRLAAESFFVVEGRFALTVAGQAIEAGPGDFVLVPAGAEHVIGAQAGGGTVLVAWAPSGLERMFIELSQLSPQAILDPEVRAAVATRHDSRPTGQ